MRGRKKDRRVCVRVCVTVIVYVCFACESEVLKVSQRQKPKRFKFQRLRQLCLTHLYRHWLKLPLFYFCSIIELFLHRIPCYYVTVLSHRYVAVVFIFSNLRSLNWTSTAFKKIENKTIFVNSPQNPIIYNFFLHLSKEYT